MPFSGMASDYNFTSWVTAASTWNLVIGAARINSPTAYIATIARIKVEYM